MHVFTMLNENRAVEAEHATSVLDRDRREAIKER